MTLVYFSCSKTEKRHQLDSREFLMRLHCTVQFRGKSPSYYCNETELTLLHLGIFWLVEKRLFTLHSNEILYLGTMNFTALYCTTLNYTAIHFPLHGIALHCTLHCPALPCTFSLEGCLTSLHYTALPCTKLHCTALHYITLHCPALHYTALPCTSSLEGCLGAVMRQWSKWLKDTRAVCDWTELGAKICSILLCTKPWFTYIDCTTYFTALH